MKSLSVEKPRSLFCYLAIFAFALAAPPIAIAAIATFHFANAERSRLEAVVDKANADVARTIESTIGGTAAMLQALATSPNLTSGDLRAFHAQARVVADLQNVTIVLSDEKRQQFVNTAAEFGVALPKSNDMGHVDFGQDGKQPYVSNLFQGAVTQRNVLRVVIPVHQNDRVVFHLSGTIDPAVLSRSLRESLKAGPYFATILDRNGVIIGRSVAPEEFIGRPLPTLADSASGGAAHGVWEGVNPQGVPIFVYWRRPAGSGWVIATGISQSALRAPLTQSLLILVHVALVIILIAGGIAGWIGRKMVRAQFALVALAERLSSGEVLKAPNTPLVETNLVGRAIEAASERLFEQSTQIARAQETLERRIEQRTRDLAHKTALLETTVENMDQGLIAVNDDGAVTICNQKAWTLLDGDKDATRDFNRAGKLLSRLRRSRSSVRPIAANGRGGHAFEHEDARGVCLEVRATPVPHGGSIYTLADVTQTRLHAKELQAAKECAERASLAKTELLATMSHEIRTPLNSVLGSADLLAEQPEIRPGQRRLVDRIIKAGTALTSMMEDVLDLANIEAGRFHIRPRRFSLVELIDDIEALTSAAFAVKDLTFSVTIDAHLPKYFEGDDSRLRQVLLNYVNNGVKFSFTGKVDLAVSGSRLESGQWAMRFAVTDTGIGISAEKQKHLFRQFTQADPSIGRRFGGTGLGLSICKRLVETMGGEVGVESELGKGSTLWFTLILPEADGAEQAEPTPPPAATVAKARILVAEDMPVNQDIARELLESLGHSVEVVSSGEEAVAAVQKAPFDLILMDIFMSGLNGLDATRAIRKLEHPSRALPIVACTANALPTQVAQYKHAGLDGFVAKPLRRGELRAIIERFALRTSERDVARPQPEPPASGGEIYTAEKLLKLLGPAKTLAAVKNFEASLDMLLAPLRDDAAEREKLARNAHSLISISSLFGMSSLSSQCRALETACESFPKAKRQLGKMKNAVNCARLNILQLKSQIDNNL